MNLGYGLVQTLVYHFIIGDSIIMKNNIFFIILLIFCSCSISRLNYDDEEKIINLNYDYFFIEDGSIYFDIFYSIPYQELIFLKKDDGFHSKLISSISIKDEDNNTVFSDSWSDEIFFDYYEKTKSREEKILNFSISLQKNILYSIDIELHDYLNQKHWNFKSHLNTNSFESLSDLKLYVKENNQFINIENFKNNSYDSIDTIWVKYQIVDDAINSNSVTFEIVENSISSTTKNQIIEIDSSQIFNYSINLVPISLSEFSSGRITVNCYYKDIHKQKSLILSNRKLIEYNYSILLKPMEYIMDKNSYIKYNVLDSLEKIDYIFNYWNQDQHSDLLDEFYSRVVYSNSNFKSIKSSGSQSDKGKIYIIYGKPINIDYNFTQNGDYEIWYYNDKKIIFINRFGYYECYQC